MSEKSLLSAIIPVGTNDAGFYLRRLEVRDSYDLSGVETVIIADGCSAEAEQEIKAFCEVRGYSFASTGQEYREFSSPRARNLGLDVARGEFIIQEDADVVYQPDFYQRLRLEFPSLEMLGFTFLTIPTIYVTEAPSARIMNAGVVSLNEASHILTMLALEPPKPHDASTTIQHFVPASGILACSRKMAFIAGGYDEEFNGWGGEDRDFAFRLLRLSDRRNFPRDFPATKAWNLNDTVVFEGWRALYRTIGDYSAIKGLYGFHLYHERQPWRNDRSADNMAYAKEKAAKIEARGSIMPRPVPSAQPDIVLGLNPHIANPQVIASLPNPVVVEERPAKDAIAFADQISARNPNSIIMWNPYGTPWRLSVYKRLRELGEPVIVAERGALPFSLYFDRGGLSVESRSYDEERWNRPLSDDEALAVRSYIDDFRFGTQALEKQANRIGAALTKLRLGIPAGHKILLVPLQLFDDTVTTYFSARGREYDVYIHQVRKLALSLPDGWVLVYKTHPLAKERTRIDGGIAADDFHINDLIEAASAVTVFNSGTGMMAMAFGKPAFIYGASFYRIEGVNQDFIDADQLRSALPSLAAPDSEKVTRFFHYLTTEFYSMCDWEYSIKSGTDLSNRVKLERLWFKTLNIPGICSTSFAPPILDIRKSVLFDRYKGFEAGQKAAATSVKSPPDRATPPLPIRPPSIYRRPLVPVVRPFVRIMGTKKDVEKFNADPAGFFAGLSNPWHRATGRVLFPPGRR